MKNTVRVERARKDWTQAELAERVGVSRQTICAIERRDYAPSTVLALKLARAFDVPVETLFTLEDDD
ncbi:MAG: transcriptional regulator [Bacteroidetes bacterium QS_9_68_14]|nr:MAG: transcriptional regulator [Bacteroidetes bacterium QS_9_68_14]